MSVGVGSRAPGLVIDLIGGESGCRPAVVSRCMIEIAPGIICGGPSRLSDRARMIGVFIIPLPPPT